MLFVQDAKKSKSADSDLLDDCDEDIWEEISERFPGKSAINCLQRYSRMKISESNQGKTSNTSDEEGGDLNHTTSSSTMLGHSGSDNQKRSASDDSIQEDAKRAKVSDEPLTLWTEEETNMLREMVTQFPNSEYYQMSELTSCGYC